MAIGTTAAILGSAALGAGASYLGNRAQSQAAGRMADASRDATAASVAEQRRQYDLSRQDMMPWLNTGSDAISQLANLYGLNGATWQARAMQQFQASPDYQFRLKEGNRNLMAQNAALGIQDSGAAQKALLAYGQNLASGEFNNYANRLAGLSGVGQTAAQNNSAAGQNFANSYGNLLGANAQNLASSYQQQGMANANMWGNLAGIGAGLIGRNSGSPSPTAPGGSLWGLF